MEKHRTFKTTGIPSPSLLDRLKCHSGPSMQKRIPNYKKKNAEMRPDTEVYSELRQHLIMIKRTVPFEHRIQEQHIFKIKNSDDPAKQLKQIAGVK